ncbi:MAG: diguanylate cyclase [Solibacillus sp.]|uniref:diguanylate cyclase n=1 Tax=unclassified Solibacillus TaxID=2637870 RepID=UPI003101307C
MKYSAKSQRQLILFYAFLCLISGFFSWLVSVTIWISAIAFIFCFFMAFVKYSLIVNKHIISYTILLFGLRIYSKEVAPAGIEEILFKRISWKTKMAIIKTRKGIPIRVALFKPENVYDNLIVFCEENEVPYKKTKDYKIIENMG